MVSGLFIEGLLRILLVGADVGGQVLSAGSRLRGILLVAGGVERAASVRSELGAGAKILLSRSSLVTAELLAAVVLLATESCR